MNNDRRRLLKEKLEQLEQISEKLREVWIDEEIRCLPPQRHGFIPVELTSTPHHVRSSLSVDSLWPN
jgi:hypothetical protein